MRSAFTSGTTSEASFHRVVASLVFVVAVSGVAGCSSSSKSKTAGTTTSAPHGSPASTAPSRTGVATGASDADATRDVTVGKRLTSGDIGSASVQLTVTNHSSAPTDYEVGLVLVAAKGTRIATKTAFVNEVGPGRTKTQPVNFLQSYKSVPAGARVTVQTVQRYPAG